MLMLAADAASLGATMPQLSAVIATRAMAIEVRILIVSR